MFSSQIYCVTFVNHRCTGGFTYFTLHFIHATFCIEPRKLRNAFSGRQNQEEQISIPEVKSPDDRLMERVMRVINENLGNPALTVEMISTEVGISRVHLHRKLKELTNQTTQQLIRNLRLKQAATLLADKRHSITEVATLTGFTHPTYFATAFREMYGISPSEYMERHIGQDKTKDGIF